MAENWCSEHNVAFFKKGGMKGYAHPIGDTGRWCNKPKEEEATTETKETKPPSKGYKADPAKTSSIEKQTALIQACVLCAGGAIDKLMVVTYAEFFHKWLKGDIGIPKEKLIELFGKYVKAQTKD